jgi:hypothetical protein
MFESVMAGCASMTIFPNGFLFLGCNGISLQAIEQNPVFYELINELGFRSEWFTARDWLHDYAYRRYNRTSNSIRGAWDLLLEAAYSRGFSWNSNWIGVHAPAFDIGFVLCARYKMGFNQFTRESFCSFDLTQDPIGILHAALLLIDSSLTDHASLPTFNYDVVDVTRQVLANLFYDVNVGHKFAWQDCPNNWGNCQDSVIAHQEIMRGLFNSMEVRVDLPMHDSCVRLSFSFAIS